jgi:hypothetical protein
MHKQYKCHISEVLLVLLLLLLLPWNLGTNEEDQVWKNFNECESICKDFTLWSNYIASLLMDTWIKFLFFWTYSKYRVMNSVHKHIISSACTLGDSTYEFSISWTKKLWRSTNDANSTESPTVSVCETQLLKSLKRCVCPPRYVYIYIQYTWWLE